MDDTKSGKSDETGTASKKGKKKKGKKPKMIEEIVPKAVDKIAVEASRIDELRQLRQIQNLYPEPSTKVIMNSVPVKPKTKTKPLTSAGIVMTGLAQHTDLIKRQIYYAREQKRLRE